MIRTKEAARELLNKSMGRDDYKGIYADLDILARQSSSRLNTSGVISIDFYIDRIFKYFHAEPSTYALGLIYLLRAFSLQYRPTQINMHKTIFMCFQTASKINEDKNYSIDVLALISGCPRKDLVRMEIEFLEIMKFDLFVDPELLMDLEIF